MSQNSPFIVYVDESGDHSLDKIDEAYPVFVLAFCAFYQDNYVRNVVSALEKLKFDKFGHDIVILHERDIRKELDLFSFNNREDKESFIVELNNVISGSNFIIIACVIDKRSIRAEAAEATNAYHIALQYCLESLVDLLEEKGNGEAKTCIVFERRGKREDGELELEFRRICDGANRHSRRLPFEIILADKKVNSAGLQLADLVARPIGINYLRPKQENRAFKILEKKFFCRGGRRQAGSDYQGWGLHFFPAQKSEKPR